MEIEKTITILDCQKVLDKHHKKKGDSWKTCDIQDLRNKLDEEFKEYLSIHISDAEEEYKELLDVINVATMLAERLRGKK